MAFVTSNRRGSFEVRESRLTPDGPRSRTLATFRQLDRTTIEKVLSRVEKTMSGEQLVEAALRAGATVAPAPIDQAAQTLIRSIARGERLDERLRHLLTEILSGDEVPAAEWLGASMAERGAALRDLLSLVDALPLRARPREIGFPRIDSTGGL